MADSKITGLTEDASPISTDLVETADDPGGTPISKKVTVGNLTKGLSQATEIAQGVAPLSTQAKAEAGSNDTDIMTPLKTSQAIAALGSSGAFEYGATLEKTAVYTILSADAGKLLTGDGTFTFTLPASFTSVGQDFIDVANIGVGSITVSAGVDGINQADNDTVVIPRGTSARFTYASASDPKWRASNDLNTVPFVASRILGSESGDSAYKGMTAAEAMGVLDGTPIAMADALLSRPEVKDYSKTQNVQATATGATTLDLLNGNEFFLTLTGAITLTFSNPPTSGKVGVFTLKTKQDGTGSHTITWPASVDWAGGSSPTISTAANAVDFFTFHTDDAGTIWYGFTPGLDMS